MRNNFGGKLINPATHSSPLNVTSIPYLALMIIEPPPVIIINRAGKFISIYYYHLHDRMSEFTASKVFEGIGLEDMIQSPPPDVTVPTITESEYEIINKSCPGPGADSPALDCLTPARQRCERRIDKIFALEFYCNQASAMGTENAATMVTA